MGVFDSISTHDLTKRSTPIGYANAIVETYFNSRPHEEVDASLSGNRY